MLDHVDRKENAVSNIVNENQLNKNKLVQTVLFSYFYFRFTLALVIANGFTAIVTPSITLHCGILTYNEKTGCYLRKKLIQSAEPDFLMEFNEKWFDIQPNEISAEHSGAFLPPQIFSNHSNIEEFIVLTGLLSIQKENFENAADLKELILKGNQLMALPANVFEHAENLERLDVSNNQLRLVADFAFSGLTKLRSILLNNNSLLTLTRDAFNGAANIQILDIMDNQIESIEDGAFNIPQLINLYLSRNRLRSLSDGIFISASGLSTVWLGENRITHIGEAFYNCQKVKAIVLDDNRIDDIDLIRLASIPGLLTLSLKSSGFRLPATSAEWPAKTSSLIKLDISKNGLSDPDLLIRLQKLSNLEVLTFNENLLEDLSAIDSVKKLFPNITQVEFYVNKLTCGKQEVISNSLNAQGILAPTVQYLTGDAKAADATCILNFDFFN